MTARSTTARVANGHKKTPIRKTGVYLVDSGAEHHYINRILVGTPSRGTVRIEWHAAMRSLLIPANWANGWYTHIVDEHYPVRFTVAHAQNVIVDFFMKGDYEWLLFIEDDVMPPYDLYQQLDKYLRNGPPIVSGLYFQKAFPLDPLVYRGRGNGSFGDWKPGEKVWVDGVPTGCLLIHRSILEIMYRESPEYVIANQKIREVFVSPLSAITDEDGNFNTFSGTSDLEWCRRVVNDNVLKRAGWPNVARRKFPFLIDTSILCKHIAPDGTQYSPI